MADREKKKEGREYKKIKYLENEKIFLDEVKSIFHSFWRAAIWWKITDTSFKETWKTPLEKCYF